MVAGDGNAAGGFDFTSPKATPAPELSAFFDRLDADAGGRLVVFGWAMAEDLAGGRLGGR